MRRGTSLYLSRRIWFRQKLCYFTGGPGQEEYSTYTKDCIWRTLPDISR